MAMIDYASMFNSLDRLQAEIGRMRVALEENQNAERAADQPGTYATELREFASAPQEDPADIANKDSAATSGGATGGTLGGAGTVQTSASDPADGKPAGKPATAGDKN
jgi:hypothetical protein